MHERDDSRIPPLKYRRQFTLEIRAEQGRVNLSIKFFIIENVVLRPGAEARVARESDPHLIRAAKLRSLQLDSGSHKVGTHMDKGPSNDTDSHSTGHPFG